MKELTYKQASLEDYDDFYKVKCNPENVRWSGFAAAPSYERLREWYKAQMEGDKRTIYLCYWNGEVCGFFYLDKISEEEFEGISTQIATISDKRSLSGVFLGGGYKYLPQTGAFAEEVGYGVLIEFSGRGIGTDIVREASEVAMSAIICAWVSEKNRASERCFEKNGFVKHEACEKRNLAAFSEPHQFYFWTKQKR